MHVHVDCSADVKVGVTLNVNVMAYTIVTLLLLWLVVLLLTVESIVVLTLNINFDARTFSATAAAALVGGVVPRPCPGAAPAAPRWVVRGPSGMTVAGATPRPYSLTSPGDVLRAAGAAPAVRCCAGAPPSAAGRPPTGMDEIGRLGQ